MPKPNTYSGRLARQRWAQPTKLARTPGCSVTTALGLIEKAGRVAFWAGLIPAALHAQIPIGPIPPDERLKVDVLLVVAHPDDESVIGSYLARLVIDEKKRVAVVYGTRGDGGGNAVGNEQAAALGVVREMEARTAVGSLGVNQVWFLDGRDTPSQDVLQSLETWHHGAALERMVRLVRMMRPDVIITWLPNFVIGENHGDHQAAGVIATEAFDVAGDSAVFAEQVAPPRDRTTIANLGEGLHTWQPKKLYFFSDRSQVTPFLGKGPTYSSSAVSAVRKVPFYQLAAAELSHHKTQGVEARIAAEAVASGDYRRFNQANVDFLGTPDVQLIFGKSLVGGSITGDVFERADLPPARPRIAASPPAASTGGVEIELGGWWSFYRAFWHAHDLEHLANLFPPELGVNPGASIRVPLILRNDGPAAVVVAVTPQLPQGWRVPPSTVAARYLVNPHNAHALQLPLQAPSQASEPASITLTVENTDAPGTARTIPLRVQVLGTMPL